MRYALFLITSPFLVKLAAVSSCSGLNQVLNLVQKRESGKMEGEGAQDQPKAAGEPEDDGLAPSNRDLVSEAERMV